MIISPKKILKEGIIKDLFSEKDQIQQNGIDLTLGSLSRLENTTNFDDCILSKNERKLPKFLVEIPNKEGFYFLSKGIYDVVFNEYIKIPNGMCAEIIQRSTLNRTGNFITAGLYDAGFENRIGAILHVEIPIILEENVRLAQIVFHQAEDGDLYDGIYKIGNN